MSDSGTKITSTVPLVTNVPGGGGVYRQTCYSTSGAQLGGVGYLIIETGIPTVPTTYLHLDFGYYFYGTSFAGHYPGNIQVSMLCADNQIYGANANSTGKMRFGQGIKVGRKTSDNTVVIILGDGVSAINSNHVWLKSIQCSNGSVGYCGENFVYFVGTDLAAYTSLNDMVAPNTSAIAPMLLSNNLGGSGVNNLIVLSNPQGGAKDRAGIAFRSRIGGIADPTVDQGYVIEGVNTGVPTAKSGISIRTNSANSYGDGSTETAFFGRNGFVSIGAYAGNVLPAYQLDVQGTSAAIRLNPHNTTLTGTEGLLFANSVTKGLKGHDGTSFYRIPKFTDAAPANGQIPVFNSTSGMYTATTPAYLTAEVDGSVTNEGELTVGAGGANTSTIVSNTSGSTPVTIAGGTNVTVTEAGSTITIAASGGTMTSWTAAADAGTPANVTNATTLTHAGGIGLSTSVSGSTVTTNLAQSEVTVKGTAESDQYFLIYDATDGVSWNLDFDVLKAAIVAGGNGVYGGSGTVPDFTTAADAGGASVSWNDGNLNLGGDVFLGDVTTGTPNRLLGVTATNLVVEYTRKDTLVIPIYCQGWNDAIATGTDYRGWRVPSHLNNARIIKIQYSADDINGGTVLLQTTNGGTNFGSATIPVGGDVESGTISQTITTGQRIRPDVNTVTGSPNGLMMNLIIEK